MNCIRLYWETEGLNSEVKEEVYSTLLESSKEDSDDIDLSEVNGMLSELDEADRNFGDIDEIHRKLRVFEINENPLSGDEQIYTVENGDYAVKVPQRDFDYLIVDGSNTKREKFLPVAEVVATVQYDSKQSTLEIC